MAMVWVLLLPSVAVTQTRYKVPPRGMAPPSPPAKAQPNSRRSERPDSVGEESLLADVGRIVRGVEGEGWFVDEKAYDEIHPLLLESVCRASLEARRAALERLRQRSQAAGDPNRLFGAAGGELTGAVEDALTARREFLAMQRAVNSAERDCPFWIRPERNFKARQTVRNQWALHLESGGLAQLRKSDTQFALGGGGTARVLVGRGIGNYWSLLTGVELGGGALLRSSETGQFTINWFPAIPVVFRHRDIDWLYDLELAPVGLFQSHDTSLSYGGRVGITLGVSVLRARGLLPWAGVAVMGEHFFPSGGRDTVQFIRGGLRVGFRWVP